MSLDDNIEGPIIGSDDIAPISITDEMKKSYLDYAMSVIVSRALPDARDGLKPVHRRIVYSMNESGFTPSRPYRKSANIVGAVMGKYHPHGDSAIYDAMVRLAQSFSMRVCLVDGQGNFGSMDGDKAAAMRYTEARMTRAAAALVEDIDKDTVDFHPNYDESTSEPDVLPARYPNLLINGAGGIAVGMATNMLPHNPTEVITAACALIDNPELTVDDLLQIVPAPDFPTGGIIMGRGGAVAAARTGRGSIIVRGRATVEDNAKGRGRIIITEIPWQVNKARMVEQVAECAKEGRIEGIAEIRDESDRHGVRVVVEVKKDFEPEVVLNQLYRYTSLQTSYGVNALALDKGRPRQMNLKELLKAFLEFREETIRRRTIYMLNKARDRAHILAGLAVAVANVDEVIAIIRNSPNRDAAEQKLLAKAWPAEDIKPLIDLIDEPGRAVENGVYQLSPVQARQITELRLHRLTGLERDKIRADLEEIAKEIAGYLEILQSRQVLLNLMKNELLEVREKFGDERRSEISDMGIDIDDEDLIMREDMVITVSSEGYIKRVPLNTYRAQRRGGKGRSGMATKDEDFVSQVYMVNTHTPVLFFSNTGMVYKMKVYKLPVGSPQSKGRALINLLPLKEGESITTLMPLPEDEDSWKDMYAVFATDKGYVRRNVLADFTDVRANGKIAMKLLEDEHLIGVMAINEGDDIILNSYEGNTIRFNYDAVRVFAGRNSRGVRGINLSENDRLISMSSLRGNIEDDTEKRSEYLRWARAMRREEEVEISLTEEEIQRFAENEEFVLTVTENGFGKRTSAYEYRVTNRGGKGISAIDRTEKTGPVIAAFPVDIEDQLVMVSDGGQLIRLPLHNVRVAGRRTQGVTLFKVAEGEKVVSVTRLTDVDDEDMEGDEHINPETGEVVDATEITATEDGAIEDEKNESPS